MCFGTKPKTPPTSSPIPPRVTQTNDEKQHHKQSPPPRIPDPRASQEYGESIGLNMFAKHQRRIEEQYPDGKVPEDVRRFRETGMAQGNLGGPVGGGTGMGMSA